MRRSPFKEYGFVFSVLVVCSVGLSSPAFGQVVTEDLKIIPADGASADQFGFSVDVYGDLVVIGSPACDDNGLDSGAAYLFDYSIDAQFGAQIFKLYPNDPTPIDFFGRSVAIHNGLIGVTAMRDDDNGLDSGSVSLFSASTGIQTNKLLASDGAPIDLFGYSIAIDANTIAVGAIGDDDNIVDSGSVYLFRANTGIQYAKLHASDPGQNDWFGSSVAVGSGAVVVGAHQNNDNGSKSGSVYVFDANTGNQIHKLLPNDGAAEDFFGQSVAIHNGIIAVGAYGDDDNGSLSGSVYLFRLSDGAQLFKFLPNDGAANEIFGFSVAIEHGVVAIGAPANSFNPANTGGSVYLFNTFTGVGTKKLAGSDGATNDQFGYAVAINNELLAVGARSDDDHGSSSGSTYMYDVDCPADLNGDGVLNFFDVSVFLTAFAAQSDIADFNNDGQLNFFDVSAFLAAFSEGCP